MTAGTEWHPVVGATPDTLRNDGFRPFIVFYNTPQLWGHSFRRAFRRAGVPVHLVLWPDENVKEATCADYQPARP